MSIFRGANQDPSCSSGASFTRQIPASKPIISTQRARKPCENVPTTGDTPWTGRRQLDSPWSIGAGACSVTDCIHRGQVSSSPDFTHLENDDGKAEDIALGARFASRCVYFWRHPELGPHLDNMSDGAESKRATSHWPLKKSVRSEVSIGEHRLSPQGISRDRKDISQLVLMRDLVDPRCPPTTRGPLMPSKRS